MTQPDSKPIRILIVEDHAMIARLTAELVEEIGCRSIGPAPTVDKALRLAESERPDWALVDLSLTDGSGLDLVQELRKMGVRCAIVSGFDRLEVGQLIPTDVAWLPKPLELELLRELLGLDH